MTDDMTLMICALDKAKSLSHKDKVDPLAVAMFMLVTATELAASDPAARIVLVETLKRMQSKLLGEDETLSARDQTERLQ